MVYRGLPFGAWMVSSRFTHGVALYGDPSLDASIISSYVWGVRCMGEDREFLHARGYYHGSHPLVDHDGAAVRSRPRCLVSVDSSSSCPAFCMISSWDFPLTSATFARPRVRKSIRVTVALLVVGVLIASLGLLLYRSVEGGAMVGGDMGEKRSFVGIALLCIAFLVYWMRVAPVRPSAKAIESVDGMDAWLAPSGWLALEQADTLSKTLRRALTPAHLVLASFATQEGAMVLARLGVTFEGIQEPFVRLVRAGEVTDDRTLSSEIRGVLERSIALAQSREHLCGALEFLRITLVEQEAIREALERAGAKPAHVEAIGRWLEEQARIKAEHDAFVRLAHTKPDTDLNRTMTARQTTLLNSVSEDLTRLAKHGHIAPVIRRDELVTAYERGLESGLQVALFVGAEGVGKTAFIEGLARAMVEEKVPSALFDKRLVSVHVAQLVTGADAGQISERLLQLTEEVAQSGNIVLVLEGLEALVGAGYGGTRDLLDLLSASIERLGLSVIATTTPTAYTESIEGKAFAKRATVIRVEPPTQDTAERIAFAHVGGFEYAQNVFFSYEAIETGLRTGMTATSSLGFPGNALGWLSEAAVQTRATKGLNALVTREDVGRIIEEKTGIPSTALAQDEAQDLLTLESRLQKRVIGQEEAVRAVARAMRRSRAQLRDARRPIASFLFLGPTGVGKTELAKALAHEYFGAPDRLIRLDGSEYQHPSSIDRFIGHPGDPKGGILTEAVRAKPYALLLIDEIEKAHPDILTLFLQMLDDGRITDGLGRTIDCTHLVIIATSNAAAKFIQEQVRAGVSAEVLKTALLERELLATFRPEFLNRFDAVEVFAPLSVESVTRIAWLMVRAIQERVEAQGYHFVIEDAAVELFAKLGYDPEFGARPLRRVLQDTLETALADILLQKQVQKGDTLRVDEHGQVTVQAR